MSTQIVEQTQRSGLICGAKTKKGPCNARPMKNGRCRMHGGNAPTGMDHPSFKHGRYSKYLPARLAERYEESLNDSDLLSIGDGIAIMDLRLSELFGRLEKGESDSAWEKLLRIKQQIASAQRINDTTSIKRLVNDMIRAVDEGKEDYAVWKDINATLEQRRKLAESEHKRLVQTNQMITSERAMLMILAIIDIIKQHVTDKDVLRKISREIRNITLR